MSVMFDRDTYLVLIKVQTTLLILQTNAVCSQCINMSPGVHLSGSYTEQHNVNQTCRQVS